MKALSAFAVVALLSLVNTAAADCIVGAKLKMQFIVLDSHTILLKGGGGNDILIKSLAFSYPTSEVTVLKDWFCDYEDAVLHVDGEVIDVQQVKHL